MKHRRIYAALKRLGFSPAKALELIIDAQRGSYLAKQFIRIAVDGRRA